MPKRLAPGAFWFSLVLLSLGVAAVANAQDRDRCGSLTDVIRLGFNETKCPRP